MEPFEYLRIARRRWWVIALAVLFSLVAVVLTTPAKPKPKPVQAFTGSQSYRATHVLLQDGTDSKGTQSAKLVAFFVKVGEVPKRAAARLGYTGDPAALAAQVSASADADIGVVKIEASAPDPDRAAELANVFAAELIAYLNETLQTKQQQQADALLKRIEDIAVRLRELERTAGAAPMVGPIKTQYDALQRQYMTTYDRYNQLLATPPPTSGLFTVQEAVPTPGVVTDGEKKPTFQPPKSRGGRLPILLTIGLLVGVGAALVIERLDTRLRTKEATEAAVGLPVLAEVPVLPRHRRHRHEVVTTTDPASMIAEAYRMLRAALLLTPRASAALAAVGAAARGLNGKGHDEHVVAGEVGTSDRGRRVILIASPGPSEGKTTSVANLAATFAESGNSVLVLNCDFYNPQIHHFFGVDEGVGLTDVLTGAPGAPELEDIARQTAIPGVRVVTSGRGKAPIEPLALGPRLVARARRMADIVLIDTSPLLATSDASELIPCSDAVLVVVRAGRTTEDEGRRAGELLARLGAPAAGAVLVGARETGPRRSTDGWLVKVSHFVDRLASLLPHARRLPAATGPAPSPPPGDGAAAATAGLVVPANVVTREPPSGSARELPSSRSTVPASQDEDGHQ